jgi:murein DD-endopeptidase MepM/ murein hydrolase activator NlpD
VESQYLTKQSKSNVLKNKRKTLITLGTTLGLLATIIYPTEKSGNYLGASMLPSEIIESENLGFFPITIPTVKYGFALDTFQVIEDKVKSNQTLGTLLSGLGVNVLDIERLAANSKDVFDINRDFRIGRNYTVLSDPDDGHPEYLILEPNVYEYIIFNLRSGMEVQKVLREIETKRNSIVGKIESSLWVALTEQNVSPEAAAKMEDALQWAVDFSHTQEGDEFKLLYDENYIKDEVVGAGQVYAAYYKRDGKEHYSFWFDNGDYKGFYDLEGRPAKSSFLKSPLKYTRISSSYNLKRFHPILKRVRPHLGTDYAAPHGTPIYAVGDGTVEEAAYSKGNGKYVKIKHDKVYQTQYLHMSRFAKGMRRGARVSQGDVIGYVGSTGLATGPHVCFRFWKNGRQVNHLKENLPQARQLPREVLEDFFKKRDDYLLLLKGEPFNGNEEIPVLHAAPVGGINDKTSSP